MDKRHVFVTTIHIFKEGYKPGEVIDTYVGDSVMLVIMAA